MQFAVSTAIVPNGAPAGSGISVARPRRVPQRDARSRTPPSSAFRRAARRSPRRARPAPAATTAAPPRSAARRRPRAPGSARPGSRAPARCASASPICSRSASRYCGASAPVAQHRDLARAERQRGRARRRARPKRRDATSSGITRAGSPRPRRASRAIDVAAVGGVEQQAGVAPAGLRVRRQQRPQPHRRVGHARIGVGHRAGRAHGRAGAAAHAQVRLDPHVVAVRADRLGRADVDALRAAGLLRPAVRADRALYAKYLGFSNSPTIAASSPTACACATGSAPGAK